MILKWMCRLHGEVHNLVQENYTDLVKKQIILNSKAREGMADLIIIYFIISICKFGLQVFHLMALFHKARLLCYQID